jgi:hypothetical protein
LQQLLSEPSHRDTWLFLKELKSRTPFSEGVDQWIKTIEDSDAKTTAGQVSNALTWAHVLETGTVSFYGDATWQSGWIDATCTTIDADAQLSERQLQIRNVSNQIHVDEHHDWLKELGCEKVPSASELWTDKDNRFPGLRFLGQVRKQFEDLATTGAPFQSALSQLASFSDDAVKWGGIGTPAFSMKEADGEHDGRRHLSRFTDEVDGIEYDFNRHIYFTGGYPGRIHFRLSEIEKKFVVAYIGFKL